MNLEWEIIDSGCMHPDAIMQKDSLLLDGMKDEQKCIIHLYEWDRPCLTYGYFTTPSNYLNMEGIKKYGIHMAKRPTGGGIIFHLSDFAFSILLPASHPKFSTNTLENYAYVNGFVAKAIEPLLKSQVHFCNHAKTNDLSFCMANPTHFDLLCDGKKLGGAAQRKTKFGLLHQGSISLNVPDSKILGDILPDNEAKQIINFSYCFGSNTDGMRREIKSLFKKK